VAAGFQLGCGHEWAGKISLPSILELAAQQKAESGLTLIVPHVHAHAREKSLKNFPWIALTDFFVDSARPRADL
jgi:hypothetical protein